MLAHPTQTAQLISQPALLCQKDIAYRNATSPRCQVLPVRAQASLKDIFFFGPQYCARTNQEAPNTICESCAGINTPADCEFLERDQKADVVANCKRSCFDFYACATNADCQDTLPICNAGQCEISIFSPLDGMGGGSSA